MFTTFLPVLTGRHGSTKQAAVVRCRHPRPAYAHDQSSGRHRAPHLVQRFSYWRANGRPDVAAPDSVTANRRLHLVDPRGPTPVALDESSISWPVYVANVADAALALQLQSDWRAQWASSGTFYLKAWPPYFAPTSFRASDSSRAAGAGRRGAVEDADGRR